jgi:hypothetical protein
MNTKNENSSNEAKLVLANRYFIVFYIGNVPKGLITGYIDFTTYEGSYLNKAMTLIQISKNNLEIKDVIITNIIELIEPDFKDWTS